MFIHSEFMNMDYSNVETYIVMTLFDASIPAAFQFQVEGQMANEHTFGDHLAALAAFWGTSCPPCPNHFKGCFVHDDTLDDTQVV